MDCLPWRQSLAEIIVDINIPMENVSHGVFLRGTISCRATKTAEELLELILLWFISVSMGALDRRGALYPFLVLLEDGFSPLCFLLDSL